MRLILAVSRARPECGADAAVRARAAFIEAVGAPPAAHLVSPDSARPSRPLDEVFASEAEAGDLIDSRDAVFSTLLLRSSYTTDGAVLDGRELLSRVRHDPHATMRSIAPPFAACYRERTDGPVVLSTDSCGLRHVYHWEGDGWAAVCSSSVVLSWVVGAPIDHEAMGMFAVIGNHLLERTPFRGIAKLDAGTLCRLHRGTTSIETFDPQTAGAPVASGGRAGQAARGVTVLRDAVGACLDAYPDAGLELSGGFDSRAVLAAMPRAARRGRFALTLGTPGNPDIRVASGIAAREGLRHQVIDLTDLERVSPEAILEYSRAAARRRDCSANPMGTGVLDWIESKVDQVPRFNGQNSEFGRAHLYPGQRQQGRITDERVDRLARWRIMQNHSTDAVVLGDAFVEAGRQAALVALREQFRRFDVDWLRSLDEYYFLSRMQRWAGIDYTAAGYERVVLSPFFHPGYLAWVRACDPADRRASRVFAAMFDLLDPELSALPLHLGISPHEIAMGGPGIAVKRAAIGGAQTAAKVWQRVRKVGRGSSGADRFAELVVDAWRTVDDPTPRLERYTFLDMDGVHKVVRGEVAVSSATIAFLVDLEVLTRIESDMSRIDTSVRPLAVG
jgi:asparagine synthase (glutamine-hydrolysing)